MREMLHSAVNNLLDLPPDHPALEPSFKLLQEIVTRRAEEVAEDRG